MPKDAAHIDPDMVKIEVNIDDMPGEWLGYVMDRLFEAGANDVFYTPIYMKKNRPAVMIQLLCSQSRVADMEHILFTETTTLGIRHYPITVNRLERRFIQVETGWGPVTVKQGWLDGRIIQQAPEYDECRHIAETYSIPLKDVYAAVWKRM